MRLDREEKKYWLAYRSDESIKYELIKGLANKVGTLESSWRNFRLLKSFKPKFSKCLKSLWRSVNPDRLIDKVEQSEVNFLTIIEDSFPKSLAQINDPPFIVFYRGDISISNDNRILASVGTRKASSYGLNWVNKTISPLASKGVVIVSGLAYGIDGASHRVCLDSSGKTIAVLGGGIGDQVIYPASNRNLAKEIIESGGALISEYLPWQRPEKRYFVARNRIISGLSQAVLVVEAGQKSGSLITAEFGLDQGKDIFALPGNVDNANSFGTNWLIKEGAFLLTSANELLDYYNLSNEDYNIIKLDEIEKRIYQLITAQSLSIDELVKKTELDASQVSAILSNMEIKGLLRRVNNKYFKS